MLTKHLAGQMPAWTVLLCPEPGRMRFRSGLLSVQASACWKAGASEAYEKVHLLLDEAEIATTDYIYM